MFSIGEIQTVLGEVVTILRKVPFVYHLIR